MQLTGIKLKHAADDRLAGETTTTTSGGGSSQEDGLIAKRIDAALKVQGSPLAGYGSTFVQAGKTSNVDPRLMYAIAGAETSFATDPNAEPASSTGHNAWGWLGHSFSTWEEGITQTTAHMGSDYIGLGLTTVQKISEKWCPIGAANDPQGLNKNWPPAVTGFLRDVGGDPNDVTFKGGQTGSGQTVVTQTTTGHSRWDQWAGGRWHPEHNIDVGAEHLRECLKTVSEDSGIDNQMWMGVSAYHRGVGNASLEDPWMLAVKKLVKYKYFDIVQTTLQDARETAKANKEDMTSSPTKVSGAEDIMPDGLPTEEEAAAMFAGESDTPG
jgi:hypothetical protein